MNFLPSITNPNKGQSLVGVLVAIAIFSILIQAIFTVVNASFNLTSYNRSRITARHLAMEKLELIRNLSYDDVGTSGGIPSGSLLQTENLTLNGLSYTIKTSIIYIDDQFDETAPDDILPTDYKRARVEVSWGGVAPSRRNPIVLLTDIAPKGVETTAGGGTLSVVVFDANGDPVSQADVSIIASTLTPPINLNLKTGYNGRLLLPGAPTCISCYQVTVTKTGFSSERTYSTVEIANPNKPHQTVLEGQLTEISFAIDSVSTIAVSTRGARADGFQPLPNTSLNIRSDKTIGTDTSSQPVYKYNETVATDGAGELTLNDIEWDNYRITPNGPSYDISGSNPLLPLYIAPGSNTTLLLSFESHTTNSLLLSIVDTSATPVASATATLAGTTPGVTGNSGDPDYGQVFFPNLTAQSYALTATASGYIDYSGSTQVSGTTNEQIILTQ